MKSWWREKDFAPILNEISITDEKDIQSIVSQIYETVFENKKCVVVKCCLEVLEYLQLKKILLEFF